MIRRHIGTVLAIGLLLALVVGVVWRVRAQMSAGGGEADAAAVGGGANENGGTDADAAAAARAPVPVEVAAIESGVLRDARVLSGTLEASARFSVSPKVSGRIERIVVDLGDEIARDQVIAELEDAEFVQAVAQAEAALAVREAERAEALSAFDLANRDFDRAEQLRARGIASESQLDEIAARRAATQAALAVADAEVEQANAALELARIQLGYTTVRASWSGGPDSGVVGERFQDAGNNVQPGEPIVAVVSLRPLTAVVSVTERDYGRLRVGQPATLETDSYPGETFAAEIVRISPVFREASRQARIELRVDNEDGRLRPGMFVRVTIVLGEVESDSVVPLAALTKRGGRDVIFVLEERGEGERGDSAGDSDVGGGAAAAEGSALDRVRLVDVRVGIIEGERVQVIGRDVSGRVVVLGQQLLENGSPVMVVEPGEAMNGTSLTPLPPPPNVVSPRP